MSFSATVAYQTILAYKIDTYAAPSGAPVNITVKAQSSSSILISWQPPDVLQQNGIISSYDVEINSTLMSRKYRFLANTTNVTVTGNPTFSCT